MKCMACDVEIGVPGDPRMFRLRILDNGHPQLRRYLYLCAKHEELFWAEWDKTRAYVHEREKCFFCQRKINKRGGGLRRDEKTGEVRYCVTWYHVEVLQSTLPEIVESKQRISFIMCPHPDCIGSEYILGFAKNKALPWA